MTNEDYIKQTIDFINSIEENEEIDKTQFITELILQIVIYGAKDYYEALGVFECAKMHYHKTWHEMNDEPPKKDWMFSDN